MRVNIEPPSGDGEAPHAALQELQTLSYMVAHDLAASVRHLSGFSRLLAAERRDDPTQHPQTLAYQIEAAAKHSSAMLDQLLVYSQIQNCEMVRTINDATPLVRIASLRLASRVNGAEVALEPLGDVYADADLVSRAVTAALDNALKFCRPGIAVNISIAPDHDEVFWRMRIRDNGIGIVPEFREAAFVMFRRLNGAETYPGVGAGLAICRRIARRHGGEARFIDAKEGACFELALPHASKAPRRRNGKAP